MKPVVEPSQSQKQPLETPQFSLSFYKFILFFIEKANHIMANQNDPYATALAGLFQQQQQAGVDAGLFQQLNPNFDPNNSQQSYKQDQLAKAGFMQAAKMDGNQLANFYAMSGGYGLGNALGRAFGGEDPAQAQTDQVRSLAANFDLSTPEGMQSYGKSLMSVNPALGFEAITKAGSLQDATAKLGKPMQEQEKLQGYQANVTKLLDAQYKDMAPHLREYVLSNPKVGEQLFAGAIQGQQETAMAKLQGKAGAGANGTGMGGPVNNGQQVVPFTKKMMDNVQSEYQQANSGFDVIKEIEGLLPNATSSGFGSHLDSAMGYFGKSTGGADATAKLAPLSNRVLMGIPRFEGPQSDKDTETYKDAAGKLGNPAIPVSQRQAAAQTIRELLTRTAENRKQQLMDGGFSFSSTGQVYTPSSYGGGNQGQGQQGNRPSLSSFGGGRR